MQLQMKNKTRNKTVESVDKKQSVEKSALFFFGTYSA